LKKITISKLFCAKNIFAVFKKKQYLCRRNGGGGDGAMGYGTLRYWTPFGLLAIGRRSAYGRWGEEAMRREGEKAMGREGEKAMGREGDEEGKREITEK